MFSLTIYIVFCGISCSSNLTSCWKGYTNEFCLIDVLPSKFYVCFFACFPPYIEVKKYAAVRLGAVDVLDAVHSALKGKSLLARLPYERLNGFLMCKQFGSIIFITTP